MFPLVLTDRGLVVDSAEEQRTNIAISMFNNARQRLNVESRIAMLSTSTNGSAHHLPITHHLPINKVNNVHKRVQYQ
ncbi:hypothetical protein HC752_12410 [Vibrio sp. S9_S30]|uniref:phosphate acyltransferase n=1 Tax=Vibrio sp. S9_S30 TaxID=2720226 RepID=UPI0016810A9A|nr:hypothetical protein [Vibrio sp. S9_S30]